jgi:hypothetical protein
MEASDTLTVLAEPDVPAPRRWTDRHRVPTAVAVLLLYGALSAWAFGSGLAGHWASRYIGVGTDPTDIFMWALGWWPHALAHGQNPFVLTHVFGPYRVNAGWVTTIPLLSLLAAPLTAAAGPVVSYNVLSVAAPALTAFTTYLLARDLTGYDATAVWAGFLVGFSGYEASQMLGHLNLSMVALVPLGILILVRIHRGGGEVRPWGLIIALAAVMVAQFGISTEVLFTSGLFGALALGGLWAVEGRRARPMVEATAMAAALALLALSPWLAAMLANIPSVLVAQPGRFSVNLLNLVLPSVTTIGGAAVVNLTMRFADRFPFEQTGYLGVPLLALTALGARSAWATRAGRWAVVMLAVVLLAALGPSLKSLGLLPRWPLPWGLVARVPVLDVVVPDRLMLYVVGLAALLSGLYAARPHGPRARLGITAAMAVAAVASLPAPTPSLWVSRISAPPLVTSPVLTRVVHGGTVMVLPYFDEGLSTYYQVQSGFRLRLADGYLFEGIPEPWARLPITGRMKNGALSANPASVRQFQALLRSEDVTWAFVPAPANPLVVRLLTRSGLVDRGVALGMALFYVPARLRSNPHRLSPAQLIAVATRRGS